MQQGREALNVRNVTNFNWHPNSSWIKEVQLQQCDRIHFTISTKYHTQWSLGSVERDTKITHTECNYNFEYFEGWLLSEVADWNTKTRKRGYFTLSHSRTHSHTLTLSHKNIVKAQRSMKLELLRLHSYEASAPMKKWGCTKERRRNSNKFRTNSLTNNTKNNKIIERR